jgi:Flp pilus assembly protein TadB
MEAKMEGRWKRRGRSKSIRKQRTKQMRWKKQKKCGCKDFPCEPQIFCPCLAWKNKGLDFFWILFFCFLFLFWIWIWIWIWIFYFSYVFNLDLFPVILFALSKQKRLALGNKNLAYRVILCIGTKEVIL